MLAVKQQPWYTDSIAIHCAGKSGDWERTVQIFEALQDSNLKADVWTFTSLINACQSCGNDWKSGIEVFQDMEAQGIRSRKGYVRVLQLFKLHNVFTAYPCSC